MIDNKYKLNKLRSFEYEGRFYVKKARCGEVLFCVDIDGNLDAYGKEDSDGRRKLSYSLTYQQAPNLISTILVDEKWKLSPEPNQAMANTSLNERREFKQSRCQPRTK